MRLNAVLKHMCVRVGCACVACSTISHNTVIAQAWPQTPQPATQTAAQAPTEIVIRTKKAPKPPRTASESVIDRKIITAAPRRTTNDILSSAPGVYVSQPEGDAVASEIYLRGFNAEHGQDIELKLGDMPINQMSHIHGQGYADLNFIIPELVRSVRVTEGVYDPQQGDFAVAGSMEFDLGVRERGFQLRTMFGSFNTQRIVGIVAPQKESEETFAAFSLRRSSGFGQNRGSQTATGMGQYDVDLGNGYRSRLQIALHGSRGGIAGILRSDDVEAGRVGFYDSYPYPSAQAQSAMASRAHVLATIDKRHNDGSGIHLSTWLAWVDFTQRVNFTGFTQRSIQNPEWIGRGDLIEQSNADHGLGASFNYQTQRLHGYANNEIISTGHYNFGLTMRSHWIDQSQNLIQPPDNQIWDRRIDATLRTNDLGAYIDTDWTLWSKLRIAGGLRADALFFDVNSRLDNYRNGVVPQNNFPGYHRTAIGFAAGPRAAIEYSILPDFVLTSGYGLGYRSPQALQLAEGEQAPFTRVRSIELGTRITPLGDQRLRIHGSFFATFLSDDVVFDPVEATTERTGPTTRRGFSFQTTWQSIKWLYANASVTYVKATLDDPPAATAENPSPPYIQGQSLPYVPPWVVRVDTVATHQWKYSLLNQLDRDAAPVIGKLGFGVTGLSSRPLPYGQNSKGFVVVDAHGSLRSGPVELGIEVYNLFDTMYEATVYNYVSNWNLEAAPSRLPANHFSAAAPRSVFATLTLQI